MTMESLTGIHAYIEEQMKAWKVPGLSVAVVKNQEIVMMEGYGYRNIDKSLPVTSETLFAIGSSTKAFTALAAGILADEKILKLDTPVKEYLPDFKMFDPFATERITLRDMLCHRSGLPRHDLMWYNASLTREEIIERLRYLEPNVDFRTKWQYQNIMYMVAGYVVGHVSRSSWEEVVQKRIFRPLNMTSSQFSVDKTQLHHDYAMPYIQIEDQARVIPFRNIDTIGPAGSINSNIKDMANWVRFQINHGMHDGQRLVSNEMLDTLHTPHMVCEMTEVNENNTHMGSYGLGWLIEPYRGLRMVSHGGNIDGFTAHVAFIPAEKIGVVVLSNLNGTPLPVFISNYIFDSLLGGEVKDWSGLALGQKKEATVASEPTTNNEAAPGEKQPIVPLSASLLDLAGTYVHAGYGEMVVELVDGGLRAGFNSMLFPLTHQNANQFELHVTVFDIKTKATFLTDSNGSVDRLSVIMLFETGAKEIEFVRITSRTE
ncbi:serine hydrolase [Paenibacillus sp. p3-SID867]|uniref:serine hydrolase n=1 Tax=Paenibacillus sp. p3-SID867 TaxID=2916363 RepID=UPI0021A3BC96|nr:serine hydrolase [Paenibacillus sp. p3-SID867]MCT1402032.1 serine hydrolase [Paenibacillus sp. p3-SID867]